jgi:hypothetical protein
MIYDIKNELVRPSLGDRIFMEESNANSNSGSSPDFEIANEIRLFKTDKNFREHKLMYCPYSNSDGTVFNNQASKIFDEESVDSPML